jgi:hypothetical protein
MVHALEEIRRSLVPGGILLDLRPLAASWAVEVTSGSHHREVGRLTDDPQAPAYDQAANKALRKAARRGWFIRESEASFPFFYYWDTPEEMRNYIQEEWSDFIQQDEALLSAAKSAWEAAGTDRRMRVRLKMHLARWRKP